MSAPARLIAATTPRERRALALGGTILLGAWVLVRLVPLGLQRLDLGRARVAQLEAAASRAQAAIAGEAAARSRLREQAAHLLGYAPRLFAAPDQPEAAAELAALVTGTAALRAVRITRQDAVVDSTSGLFRPLRLRVEAVGDIRGVAAWLADLEEGDKLVRVTDLVISAVDAGAPPAQAEQLRIEAGLVAWSTERRREGAP